MTYKEIFGYWTEYYVRILVYVLCPLSELRERVYLDALSNLYLLPDSEVSTENSKTGES